MLHVLYIRDVNIVEKYVKLEIQEVVDVLKQYYLDH